MDTKALKKQMGAAIAMVLVAAVALGSATFAWFVTNNKVDATTSTISAQSNAAFMYIHNKDNNNTDLTSDAADIEANTELYPATWANHFDKNKKNEGALVYQFETATAQSSTASTIKDGTRRAVGAPDSDEVLKKYAVKNTFKVGSKGTKLTNLVVDPLNNGISIAGDATGNANLDNALRILVKCGDNWVLCDKSSVLDSSTKDNTNLLKDEIQPGEDHEVEVDIYVFYDGDDTAIFTNNLGKLKDASKKIKVTLTATADNK
ncbi:hypothetical protein [Collinsella sp. CLA-AA-H302]|uniref:hypothetical protein n=1 Tax=Collinsella sp. CLA-AA-H302 TaxID=3136217 RepID=UPI0032C10D2F